MSGKNRGTLFIFKRCNVEVRSFWQFFHLIFIFQEEELKGAILVVLANKQDIEGAMSVTEVHKALGLEALKNRTFQIFKASAIKGDGLDESMEWLSNAIQNRK